MDFDLFARERLLPFCVAMNPDYELAGHLRMIAHKLEELETRGLKRLMVFMPPRHGKSFLISKYFPAWYMGRHPDHEVIFATYAQEFASDFGRKVRELMNEPAYTNLFPNVSVAADSSAAHRFNISGGGAYYAVGGGGPLTGRGGNLIIIDDIHKNRDEAHSETIRTKLHEWFGATLYTRLMPNSVMVIVQTRWHEDDVPGRILREHGEDWEVLSLPAIRADGTALWPERYPVSTLDDIKTTIGSHDFEALYQQHPTAADGNIIKRDWFKFYRTLPARFDEQIQSWDFAVKDKETSDFTVGLALGRVGSEKFLLDQVRGRMNFPAACQAVISFSRKWPSTHRKLVEAKANGPAVIDTLTRQVSGLIAVEPDGDKVARMNAVSPDVEAGNVWLPDPSIAPWIHDFIEELCSFPNGQYDDRCDAFSQGLKELRRARAMTMPIAGHGTGTLF